MDAYLSLLISINPHCPLIAPLPIHYIPLAYTPKGCTPIGVLPVLRDRSEFMTRGGGVFQGGGIHFRTENLGGVLNLRPKFRGGSQNSDQILGGGIEN